MDDALSLTVYLAYLDAPVFAAAPVRGAFGTGNPRFRIRASMPASRPRNAR